MKPIRLLYLLILLLATGCDDNSFNASPKDGVAVETIEATANFDLSARKNWIAYVGTEKYNFEVEGNKLSITSPQKDPFRFAYGETSGNAIIQMVPENYGRPRDSEKIPFNIEDQSTPEKFMNCDRLRFVYTGEAKENLSGISIYHFNTLLTFDINNLPQNAKVFIMQAYDQKITPLKEDPNLNAYKAIVFPNNAYVALIVETPAKTYRAIISKQGQVRSPGTASGMGNSAIVSFTADINEKEELIINNFQITSYSKEWPINE